VSIVNNCTLYLLETGCLVLVSKKKSAPLPRACEEEEEKAQGKGSPPLRTNPGASGLIWLQPTLKIRPHDGTGRFSMNLYLYSAVCAFFLSYTLLCCFLRTDLRVKFRTAPLRESSINRAFCAVLKRQWRGVGERPWFLGTFVSPLCGAHTLGCH